MYHYTLGGLQDVYLVNGYAIKQTPHGEAVAFVDGEGLERAICDALARKDEIARFFGWVRACYYDSICCRRRTYAQ